MLKQKPYHLFLITAILLLPFSLLDFHSVIDILVYDTFFILPVKVGFLLFGIALAVLWFIYILCYKILFSKKLTCWHTMSTLICAVLLLLLPDLLTLSGVAGMPRRYYDDDSTSLRLFFKTKNILHFIVLLLILSQLLLLFNLIAGIVKKLKLYKAANAIGKNP